MGWPTELNGILTVAHTSDEVLVRREDDFVRLDRSGRLVEKQAKVDVLVASPTAYALLRGTTATVHAGASSRAHRGIPIGARLAIAADGTMAFCHEGAAVVLDATGAHPVTPAGASIDSLCFLGAEQTLCLAWRDGAESVVSFGGTQVRIPGVVETLSGHPERYEIVARGLGPQLFTVKLGQVTRAELACGEFTCDGEAFYAVSAEGDLACVNVASGRIARTRWESKLLSVSAGRDRFIWATRDGRILCT